MFPKAIGLPAVVVPGPSPTTVPLSASEGSVNGPPEVIARAPVPSGLANQISLPCSYRRVSAEATEVPAIANAATTTPSAATFEYFIVRPFWFPGPDRHHADAPRV